MKIATIVGARPQLVKAAAVSPALRARSGIKEILIHTGQHYDENMSAIFFNELGLALPDYALKIGSGPHGQQTGRMLEAIEQVLTKERPDWVLVYGDTNSTLAGALAASKMHIPVAHVEAGMRSFNRRMPEETNRVLTDHLSDLLFAVTAEGARNLELEGIPESKIHVIGDVMYDATLRFGAVADPGYLRDLGLAPKEYALATVHRAENTDDVGRLSMILEELCGLSQGLPVVMPLHPRTRAAMERSGLLEYAAKGLRLIPPQGYLAMLNLEKNARIILTDSGGVQKEAFFFRVPSITLRKETEWVELVRLGWNRLVDPAEDICLREVVEGVLAGDPPENTDDARSGLFGGGRASGRLADIVCGCSE